MRQLNFEPISLEQMEKVQFLNRMDRKFCIQTDLLEEILYDIQDYYYVLTLDGINRQIYQTIYYDTFDNYMFHSHHNGKLNRYKIRRRNYVLSNQSFLEIKFKSNKGRTIKYRLSSINKNAILSNIEKQFIRKHSPFHPSDIHPVMENQFSRITLVSRLFNERCTIDLDLNFQNPTHPNDSIKMKNLAIIEIKADKMIKSSPLYQSLKERHIYESGFSKYCIGRSLLDEELKQNNFKIKIRELRRMNAITTNFPKNNYGEVQRCINF